MAKIQMGFIFFFSVITFANTDDLALFEGMSGTYVRSHSAISHDPTSYPCPDQIMIAKTGPYIYTISGSYMSTDRGIIPQKAYVLAVLKVIEAQKFQYKRGTYASVSGYRIPSTGISFDFSGNEYIKYFSINIPYFLIVGNKRSPSHLNCTFQNP